MREATAERGRLRAALGPKLLEIPGSGFEIPCDLVLLAMGFLGPVRGGLLDQLGVAINARGNVAAEAGRYPVPGGVRHRVVANDGPAQALDVFYPIRDEYR